MTETEGALPPPRRRRRRPRKAVVNDSPVTVTVSVVTVIRADQPYESEAEAEAWMNRALDSDFTGEILDDAIAALDRVRAADASASGIAFGTRTTIGSMLTARIGFGEGEQVASGRFLDALEVDARGGSSEKRRERLARTGSTARTASLLGDREPPTACEVMIPRIRLDLDSGNEAAARLAIGPAASATISELEFALEDEDHEKDLDRLEELLPGLLQISEVAADGKSDPTDLKRVEDALALAERVIRRRRILDQ